MRLLKDVDDGTGKKSQKKVKKGDCYGFTHGQIAVLPAAVCMLPMEVSSGKVSAAKYFRGLYDADPKHFEEKFGFKPNDIN